MNNRTESILVIANKDNVKASSNNSLDEKSSLEVNTTMKTVDKKNSNEFSNPAVV